jgi:hypothetical protein
MRTVLPISMLPRFCRTAGASQVVMSCLTKCANNILNRVIASPGCHVTTPKVGTAVDTDMCTNITVLVNFSFFT